MTRTAPPLVALGLMAALVPSPLAAQPPKDVPKAPPAKEKNSWLNPGLLASGYNLLKDKVGAINLAVNPAFDFRPVFAPRLLSVDKVEINLGGLSREQREIGERIGRETNDLLKQQLEVQKRQLDIAIRQLETAQEQTKQLTRIGDQLAEMVRYQDWQKARDKALLRRDEYKFPANKLVVVVADFSSGGNEGAEVADEIASALQELRKTYGVDVEILTGEIRPGVVIRNEQMASEVGQHFPIGTAYAVIWGTLSPRTSGKFRPHVTCVIKVDDAQGYSRSFTIDPDSQDLPTGDSEEVKRKKHEQLVGFACALVPGAYASYELSNDREPNLEKYLALLETDDATRAIAAQYRKELPQLSRWIRYRAKYPQLRRLSPVDARVQFPLLVLNAKDRSRMVLVTEPGSDQPKWFKDARGEYAVYIDETETPLRQVKALLDERGNQEAGSAPWFKLDGLPVRFGERQTVVTGPKAGQAVTTDGKTVTLDTDDGKSLGLDAPALEELRKENVLSEPRKVALVGAADLERPVTHVSFWGARDYCSWAGKELPILDEWRTAAAPAAKGEYPWGEADWKDRCANGTNSKGAVARVGQFAKTDRSGVGCLDMAGNVSEWCIDPAPSDGETRAIVGGNFGDQTAERFQLKARVERAPQTHHAWVGFRGVVRVYREK